ncbi:hypothetical protein FRC12_014150 [Ceratobasidium sp. 428]|nr:hypothetical protein FRC12_014150 [Ceratobasidium sp. 428]
MGRVNSTIIVPPHASHDTPPDELGFNTRKQSVIGSTCDSTFSILLLPNRPLYDSPEEPSPELPPDYMYGTGPDTPTFRTSTVLPVH